MPPQNARYAASLELRHASRFVEDFLASLREDMRLVFGLSEFEGLSAPEIAETLGVKLNTVYSRLRRARHRFDAALTRAPDIAQEARS